MNILHLVTLTFVVLKLTHVINWSWLLVLSPIIVPLSIAAIAGSILLIVETPEQRKVRKLLERLEKKYGK